MPDVVLTGLPRSGSTLTCQLLNRCADTVALHEPMQTQRMIQESGVDALPEQIQRFYARTRQSLLAERRAPSKVAAGRVPDNNCDADRPADGGLRQSIIARGETVFADKSLDPDFTLAIKHNTSFAALLDRLTLLFPCYAIVRNPLAVLSSWNSVQMPVQQGFVPVGEMIDADLSRFLRQMEDRTERQFYILEWFFERFQRWLPRTSILRYEDITASGGRTLALVTPAAAALNEPLASRNENAAYDRAQTLEIGEKLLGRAGAFWDFYARESVEEMLAPLRAGSLA